MTGDDGERMIIVRVRNAAKEGMLFKTHWPIPRELG
jgi:hypothetical protein